MRVQTVLSPFSLFLTILEYSFFDPSDPQCREVLLDPRTSIPELFAVLRQWVPQVQRNICVIGHEVLLLILISILPIFHHISSVCLSLSTLAEDGQIAFDVYLVCMTVTHFMI